MRVGVIKHPRRMLAYLLALFLVSSVGFGANSYAADIASFGYFRGSEAIL